MKNSLEYRKNRIQNISDKCNGKILNSLYLEIEIPNLLLKNLINSLMLYVSKAMHFDPVFEEEAFIKKVDENKSDLLNITPNGAVVPKKEYQLEYNLFLQSWYKVMSSLFNKNTINLHLFRMTPNIRIKFADDIEENRGRNLDTSVPHSDAWLEGPWGLNCHVPILGDNYNNYLAFYELIDEKDFRDDFLSLSESYKDMKWVLDYYQECNLVPKKQHINVSDYCLIHKTKRNKDCGTRISLDTTLFIGDHEVIDDRKSEYSKFIPNIPEDLVVICNRSENSSVMNKKTTFSHYTTGALSYRWS